MEMVHDNALATIFELLPLLGLTRELVVTVPSVCRRWRDVCTREVRVEVLSFKWAADALLAGRITAQIVHTIVGRFRLVDGLSFCDCRGLRDPEVIAAAAANWAVSTDMDHTMRTPRVSAPPTTRTPTATDHPTRPSSAPPATATVTPLKNPLLPLTHSSGAASATVTTDNANAQTATDIVGKSDAPAETTDPEVPSSPIRTLCLRECQRVTDVWVSRLGTVLPQLRTLDLVGCRYVTSVGLYTIGNTCQHLSTLCLGGREVNDGILTEVGRCTALQTLVLSRCPMLTDAGIARVALGCPRLRALHLALLSKVTDAAMTKLVDSVGDRLHSLEIVDCKSLTEKTVEIVLPKCPKLRSFGLGGTMVTPAWLTHIGSHGSNLRTLRLMRNAAVNGAWLDDLSTGCPNLTCLGLSYIYTISDDAVTRYATRAPTLRTLQLHCCSELSMSGIDAVAAARPDLAVDRDSNYILFPDMS